MVNIFTRKITDELASLVKKIDDTVGKNGKKKMAAFVVLLSDNPEEDEKKLKALAKKYQIKNIPLTLYRDNKGPENYTLSKDAELTVMMWVGQNVKVNHAYKSAKINKKEIAKVVASTSKILK